MYNSLYSTFKVIQWMLLINYESSVCLNLTFKEGKKVQKEDNEKNTFTLFLFTLLLQKLFLFTKFHLTSCKLPNTIEKELCIHEIFNTSIQYQQQQTF